MRFAMKIAAKLIDKKMFLAVIIAAFLLLFIACDNNFLKARLSAPADLGCITMGSVIIGYGDISSRTILPNTPEFVSYNISFKYQGEEEVNQNDQTADSLPCTIALISGSWLITVTAYTHLEGLAGLAAGNYPAASGSVSVTVISGASIPVTVDLSSGTGIAGQGILEYDVELPDAGLGSATLSILGMDRNEVTSRDLMDAAFGSIVLDSGYYLLQINFSAWTRLRTRTELIHIYSGHTTLAAGSTYNFSSMADVLYSMEELSAFLAVAQDNTAETPYSVKLMVDMKDLAVKDASNNVNVLGALFNALNGKYVKIDFTGSVGNFEIYNSNPTSETNYFIDLHDRDKLVSVILPSGLSPIRPKTFESCTALTEIRLPLTVGTVPVSAFENCVELDSLYFYGPESSTSFSFSGHTWIKTADFSACMALTTLGYRAFTSCTGLVSVILPNSVTTIGGGSYTFMGCTSLKTIPNAPNLKAIGYSAFEGCTSLYVDDETICLDLSNYTRLTDIEAYAFRNCTQFSSFILPVSLENLGNYAFSGWPDFISNMTSIDLSYLLKLKTIGSIFTGCVNLVSVTLPNSLELIGEYCFSGCTALTTINFPFALKSIGTGAFQSCSGLRIVDLSSCSSITGIGGSAFKNCSGLSYFIMDAKNTLTSIGANAFENTLLASIDLRNYRALTTVGADAFKGTGITSLDLSGCTSLQNIDSFNTATVKSLDFTNCTALSSISNTNFYGNTNIKSINFFGCTALTSIGNYAFYNCTSLESINLSGCTALTSIGNSAFQKCSALKFLDLSGCTALATIGELAFNSCSFTSLDLSNYSNLSTIGARAFSSNAMLKIVNLSNTHLTVLNVGVFSSCTALETINLAGCTMLFDIYEVAFGATSSLISVDFTGIIRPPTLHEMQALEILYHPFSDSSISAIYVNQDSVAAYKNAAIWKTRYAALIQAKP